MGQVLCPDHDNYKKEDEVDERHEDSPVTLNLLGRYSVSVIVDKINESTKLLSKEDIIFWVALKARGMGDSFDSIEWGPFEYCLSKSQGTIQRVIDTNAKFRAQHCTKLFPVASINQLIASGSIIVDEYGFVTKIATNNERNINLSLYDKIDLKTLSGNENCTVYTLHSFPIAEITDE